jgi:hypothetical protein
MCWPGTVQAQNARPFEDVKPGHWAYQAAADLHARGVITGYPDGHFNGQRTLTRYEFAVALKRALDGIVGDSKSPKADAQRSGPLSTPGAAASAGIPRSEAEELQRLAVNFNDELVSLGMDTKDVLAKLNKLVSAGAGARQPDRIVPSIGDAGRTTRPESSRLTLGGSSLASTDFRLPPLGGTRSGYGQDGFGIRAKIGSATATVFGGSLGSRFGSPEGGLLSSGLNSPSLLSPLQSEAPSTITDRRLFGSGTGALNFGGSAGSGFLDYGGPARGRVFGIQGELPISRNGAVGLSYLDFSADRGGITGPGSGLLGAPIGDVTLYGANVRLNSMGRFALTGEASKSLTSRRFADDSSSNDDNNAYLLNLKYDGGPITGAAGYQYYDPRFTSPAYVNSLGGFYNPANLQGPYARVGGRVDRLQADLGVDYLTAARNRPGFGGFTQGSSVFRGQAGLGYHFSKQFELTANYEGVLYDMSGAVSASGLRAKPVEQYITLGAGLNISGNTVLRLAYQIINVQDAGGGFGLGSAGGGNTPGGASTSVFSTQFAVHF